MELGTVLGVWAHPDDETYLSSGLMAQAVRDGGRVVCVTATRGEGGSYDEERWPTATLGGVRERELLASLALLGVTDHEFLGLPDIDMDTPLPESGGAADVRRIVEATRPDTVLTFGPDGMTGHKAHQSVSRWATDAFHAAAPPGSRLYYAVYTQAWAEEWVPRLEPFGTFRTDPPVYPAHEIDLSFDLPDELLELKLRALAEHVSQVEGLFDVFGRDGLAPAMRGEYFRLAATKPL